MTEKRKRRDTIPEEFDELVVEFRVLLEKHPHAVPHFSLAYHPAGYRSDGEEVSTTAAAGISHQPVFECTEIEPGLAMCERVDEQ